MYKFECYKSSADRRYQITIDTTSPKWVILAMVLIAIST